MQKNNAMIKKHIPNAITCCNLICGCVSILFLCHNRLLWASGMIFVAAVFDFLDGLAARLLDAKSPIGVELDSLSDVVSFGVAPSFIVAWFLSRTGVCWWVYNFNVFSVFAFILAALRPSVLQSSTSTHAKQSRSSDFQCLRSDCS